jgi:hypothetical protein
MRYLIITLLIVMLIVPAKAQKVKTPPYLDLSVNVGTLFPAHQNDTRFYSYKPKPRQSNQGHYEALDINFFIRRKASHVLVSTGGRIGYMSFASKDTTGDVESGSGLFGNFTLGLNYIFNPQSASSFKLAMILGAGLKADGSSSYIYSSGYYFLQLSATKYLNKYLGVGLSATRYNNLVTAYSYTKYSSTLYDGHSFNVWSVSADVHFSINRIKHR